MKDLQNILSRPNISGELANRLRDMIASGTLEPGERLNEVHLAAELGVSRTPLREALTALTAEGAIFTIPRRGFFVQPLSRAEFQAIYPLRALLDPEALRLAGLPGGKKLARLEALNQRLRRAKKAARRIEIDDQWHLLLVDGCPNPVLLDLIRQFIRRTRRYEVAYLDDGENLDRTSREHGEVIAALERRDLKGACRALKQNLTSGSKPILKWLEQRDLSKEGI